jgi:hypothetical protein
MEESVCGDEDGIGDESEVIQDHQTFSGELATPDCVVFQRNSLALVPYRVPLEVSHSRVRLALSSKTVKGACGSTFPRDRARSVIVKCANDAGAGHHHESRDLAR